MAKIKIPKANKGYGYVGVWNRKKDGPTLGWMAPQFISGDNKSYPDSPNSADLQKYAKGERLFLCEITVKAVKDSHGRPITKIVK